MAKCSICGKDINIFLSLIDNTCNECFKKSKSKKITGDEKDKNDFGRYLNNTKKISKGSEIVIHYLAELIGSFVNNDMHILETQQSFPAEVVEKFNNQPALKRLFDFYIVEFWLASFSCGLYYEVSARDEICEGIGKKIGLVLEKHRNSQFLIIKDFIKDKDELSSIYRECPEGIDENARVNFNVLLDGVLLRRFVDYNDAISRGQAFNFFMVARYFYKHIFGIDPKLDSNPALSVLLVMFLTKMFSGRIAPYFELIAELEKEIDRKTNRG